MAASPHSHRQAWGGILVLGIFALAALIFHLGAGSSDNGHFWTMRISPLRVLAEIFAGDQGQGVSADNAIVWQIRLPRGVACLLVGSILGIVGSAFQALFRNPLAEPYIVGVSSGAAVGGALALVLGLGGGMFGLGMLGMSFLGGAGALALVLSLAGRRGRTDVQSLLLAGVVIGAMLSAVLSLVLYSAGEDTNQILRWLMGMMTPMYWPRVAALAIALAAGLSILIPQGKRLNALAVGEESARRLGVDTRRLKFTILATGSAMAAVTVGTVGVIGFLGLVAPHIARRILGVDWRFSLMGSGVVGATLLTLADVLAQRLVPGAELPVGIITAILGAPFLLILMRRDPA